MPIWGGMSTLLNSMKLQQQQRNQMASAAGGGKFGSLDPYTALASQVNQFMAGQAQAPFIANLPGYQGMTQQRSANVGAQLKGDVPQDVINQILQQAAQRGIFTGSPGGPASNASYLQALGLTSLGQQKEGAAGLSQAISDTPVPEIWNPMSLFVPEYLAKLELDAARGGGGSGGSVSFGQSHPFGGGGSFGANPFNQTTLDFVAENKRKKAEADAARKKANEDYWKKQGVRDVSGRSNPFSGNLFGGGFPSFSMSGLY